MSSASPVQTITVLGAGTMGHGIAQVAAMYGFHTILCDMNPEIVKQATIRIEENLRQGIEKGKLTEAQREATLENLVTSADLESAAAQCELILEAIPEDPMIKRQVFHACAQVASGSCIFASNTSSLSISALAAQTDRPDRFLGMHFFNPPWVIPLLELVVGAQTSQETVATARAVAERMGRHVVQIKDSPGFATSRLGVVLALEAMRMLEQGVANAEDIDTAIELGYRHPMGPLKLTDLIGLDVRLNIADYLHSELGGEQYVAPALLRQLVEAGKLGRKSGEGFYRYQ